MGSSNASAKTTTTKASPLFRMEKRSWFVEGPATWQINLSEQRIGLLFATTTSSNTAFRDSLASPHSSRKKCGLTLHKNWNEFCFVQRNISPLLPSCGPRDAYRVFSLLCGYCTLWLEQTAHASRDGCALTWGENVLVVPRTGALPFIVVQKFLSLCHASKGVPEPISVAALP